MSENAVKTSFKLILSIVKKGIAREVVPSSREAGCEGGTVVLGRGSSVYHEERLLGVPLEGEQEIVFSIVNQEGAEAVFQAVYQSGKLGESGRGLLMMIDLVEMLGVCHLCTVPDKKRLDSGEKKMESRNQHSLIVTIVNRGLAEAVVEASKMGGAEGGTTLSGRGTGIHERSKLFGIAIEPEKELIFTLVEHGKTDQVLEAIVAATGLDQPGKGVVFVLPVERVAGIIHREK